jgi:hypothetical protein
MKVAIITAIYGDYDRPKTLEHAIERVDVSCYLWTDSEKIGREASDLGWSSVLDEYPNGDRELSPMLRAKYIKTHMHVAGNGADVLIWLDGSMTIIVPYFVDKVMDALRGVDVALTPHPLRTCIRPEALVTAALARYSDCDPIKQVNYYDNIGHPRDWGLFASGAFAIRDNAKTREWGEHWWHECATRTYQDQLSLPVITRIMEQKGMKWNQNLPWAQWWGITEHGM